MLTITIQPMHHNGKPCIALCYEKNNELDSIIRKLHGAKWSKTYNCWYVPKTEEHYKALIDAVTNKALLKIDNTGIKPINVKATVSLQKNFLAITHIGTGKPDVTIEAVNAHVIPKMQQYLQLKAYSANTIRTYLNEMKQLLVVLKNKPADELTVIRIKDYLQYCFTTLKLTENTLHSRMNALKFYYDYPLFGLITILVKTSPSFPLQRRRMPLQRLCFFYFMSLFDKKEGS